MLKVVVFLLFQTPQKILHKIYITKDLFIKDFATLKELILCNSKTEIHSVTRYSAYVLAVLEPLFLEFLIQSFD